MRTQKNPEVACATSGLLFLLSICVYGVVTVSSFEKSLTELGSYACTL
jgi:hypothetical protein